jgi:hypothetical protein
MLPFFFFFYNFSAHLLPLSFLSLLSSFYCPSSLSEINLHSTGHQERAGLAEE